MWLHGEVRTPPLSATASLETGVLVRRLQRGELLSPPHSRPIPSIANRCHELRIMDKEATWRVIYRIDADAIVIADVFKKKTQTTPRHVIEACRLRLHKYDAIMGGKG